MKKSRERILIKREYRLWYKENENCNSRNYEYFTSRYFVNVGIQDTIPMN